MKRLLRCTSRISLKHPRRDTVKWCCVTQNKVYERFITIDAFKVTMYINLYVNWRNRLKDRKEQTTIT